MTLRVGILGVLVIKDTREAWEDQIGSLVIMSLSIECQRCMIDFFLHKLTLLVHTHCLPLFLARASYFLHTSLPSLSPWATSSIAMLHVALTRHFPIRQIRPALVSDFKYRRSRLSLKLQIPYLHRLLSILGKMHRAHLSSNQIRS
jgi:hypothetical protein